MNEEVRVFLGIFCLAVAAGLAFLGSQKIWACVIFDKYPKKIRKVGAILQDAEQKDNVRIRTGRLRSVFVKHMTKAVYAYTVEGQVYYIKATRYLTTKRQTPKFVPVVYIITHPKFAYIDELGASTDLEYLLYGILYLFWTMLLVFVALAAFGIIS